MAETMKAAYLAEPKKIEYRDIPVPRPHPGEALVEVMACGVCGSDVHYYEHGRIGSFVVTEPIILGHECAGIVVEVGEGVTDLEPGDRVAVEPGVPDRTCSFCKSGHYNLCPDVKFLATPPYDGAFTEYIAHAADFLYKLPADVSFEAAALIEPFSVGLHAAARGNARPGQTAVVLGTGPIGLCTIQALKVHGIDNIIAVDLSPARLAAAEKAGAAYLVDAAQSNVSEAVAELTASQGADLVMETAGAAPTVEQAPLLVSRGGRIVLIGLPAADTVPINVVDMISKEADIATVFRYANVYEKAVSLLESGRIDLESMITSRFGLNKVSEALEFATERMPDTIKIMINAED